jgi:hypothetical protein
MAGFRVFVLSLWVTCVCVGLVNSEEGVGEAAAELPPENPVVFGGVEVCGPIYEAVMFLGPKDENGRLDPDQIEQIPHPSLLFRAEFRPPEGFTLEYAGLRPTSLTLGDFKGKTQSAIAGWEVGLQDARDVWSSMNEELRSAYGEPDEEDDSRASWTIGRLRTTVLLREDDGSVRLVYSCVPSEDEYWARFESVPFTEELPDQVVGWPLLAVLAQHGQPTVEPIWRGDKVVGLYYENYELLDVPCTMWAWFIDGESVYKGFEMAPIYGSSRPVESFEAMTRIFASRFGQPYRRIGGAGFDRIEHRWLNGVEEIFLRLEMADSPPWMRFETINRKKMGEISGDLRPGRKPVPRYIPAPRDSGKTRYELVGESASG